MGGGWEVSELRKAIRERGGRSQSTPKFPQHGLGLVPVQMMRVEITTFRSASQNRALNFRSGYTSYRWDRRTGGGTRERSRLHATYSNTDHLFFTHLSPKTTTMSPPARHPCRNQAAAAALKCVKACPQYQPCFRSAPFGTRTFPPRKYYSGYISNTTGP